MMCKCADQLLFACILITVGVNRSATANRSSHWHWYRFTLNRIGALPSVSGGNRMYDNTFNQELYIAVGKFRLIHISDLVNRLIEKTKAELTFSLFGTLLILYNLYLAY